MKTIAFFNHKSGASRTSLVYHLAAMLADHGAKVVAADLDPQADLTFMFLDEDRLEALWPAGEHHQTVLGAVKANLKNASETVAVHVEETADNLGIVVGDLGLAVFEADFAAAWSRCLDGDASAGRLTSVFHRVLQIAGRSREADVMLIDLGPNLSALNRAAMIAADLVIVPILPTIFAVQALQDLGSAWQRWREEWQARLQKHPEASLNLPHGDMQPLGYVIQQPPLRLDRPVRPYHYWMTPIPAVYREAVLQQNVENAPPVASDPHCLAVLKQIPSLMHMATEARKPMFFLKPADGALGAHAKAVVDCYRDFKALAEKIAARCGVAFR
ncbi:MAG: ParA family protein [bacterium]